MTEEETKKDNLASPTPEPVKEEIVVDEPEIEEVDSEPIEVVTEEETVEEITPETEPVAVEEETSEETIEVVDDPPVEIPKVEEIDTVPETITPPTPKTEEKPQKEAENIHKIEPESEPAPTPPKNDKEVEKKPRKEKRAEKQEVDIEKEVKKEQEKVVSRLLKKARMTIQLRKLKKIHRVLELFNEQERVTNEDVQKMLRVSNRTARRYFDQLEKKGRVKQVGDVGRGVYYIKIR